MLTVTPVEQRDVPALAALLEELDRFYGTTDFEPLEQRVAQIKTLIFGDAPAAYVLLARKDNEVVGFAAYSFLWPAVGITQSLYLKELYVAQKCRRRGIGKLLMEKVCAVAAENECSRVELTTDHDNPDAQCFYRSLGVPVYPVKVFYRLEGDEILRVAVSSREAGGA